MPKKPFGNCTIDECGSIVRSRHSKYCEKHYYRLRRTGQLGGRKASPPRIQSHGYIMERAEHPLAIDGSVYQHRRRAYDAHSGVCPACHWCGTPMTWAACHIDHLNGIKSDNDPSNLVVACPGCNRLRGMAVAFLQKLAPEKLAMFLDIVGVSHEAKTIEEAKRGQARANR